MASGQSGSPLLRTSKRERDRQADLARRVEHLLQHGLEPACGNVRHELDQPAAAVGDAARYLEDLVLCRVVAGDLCSAVGAVRGQPRRRETERPRLDRLRRQLSHQRHVLGGGRFPVGAAPAHDVHPQRRVRQVGGDVDVATPRVERIQVFGEGLPAPRQSVDHHHTGDVLDPGHHVDEHVMVLGAARRESHPAITHHRGGHTVRGRRRHAVRPDGLPVVMSVQIDEAGCDQQPGRVDLPGGRAVNGSDGRDHAVGDRDISDEGLTAEAVDDGAVADYHVVAP